MLLLPLLLLLLMLLAFLLPAIGGHEDEEFGTEFGAGFGAECAPSEIESDNNSEAVGASQVVPPWSSFGEVAGEAREWCALGLKGKEDEKAVKFHVMDSAKGEEGRS
ncbi:hypothetical protein B0T13DRAFT_445589 [Neurospora crassa]|nr:hypothetical protein B0T13DRAFT_445589 [Neurospora crassa]